VGQRDRPPRREGVARFGEGFAGERPAGFAAGRASPFGAARGSPRWRRIASRRLPAPRPSRAGWVELSVRASAAGAGAGAGAPAGFVSADAGCVEAVAGFAPSEAVAAAGAGEDGS
jgi:hypothetical protein